MSCNEWAWRIRRARGRRSQQWLANEVGVNQKTISLWENGAPISDLSKVGLAQALDTVPEYLFPWSEFSV